MNNNISNKNNFISFKNSIRKKHGISSNDNNNNCLLGNINDNINNSKPINQPFNINIHSNNISNIPLKQKKNIKKLSINNNLPKNNLHKDINISSPINDFIFVNRKQYVLFNTNFNSIYIKAKLMHTFIIEFFHNDTPRIRIHYQINKINNNIDLFMIDIIDHFLFKSTSIKLQFKNDFLIQLKKINNSIYFYIDNNNIYTFNNIPTINKIQSNMRNFILIQ